MEAATNTAKKLGYPRPNTTKRGRFGPQLGGRVADRGEGGARRKVKVALGGERQ